MDDVVDVTEAQDEEQQHGQTQDGQDHGQDSDVEFMGSTETNSAQDEAQEEVQVMEDQQDRSQAKTEALMAAKGFVTPAALEAEFQCIICQYTMFKPMTVFCGHSFCRVCLMDSFLTRPIEEAQCPICRVEIMQLLAATSSPSSVFNVNVTLWNAVQLLIPSSAERISSYQDEEEAEFTIKLDQLEAKWKIFFLSERAARYHGDHDEEELPAQSGDESAPWEEQRDGHSEYPVLKVEDHNEGNVHVTRNVVLDISDENEDGIMNMRVGLAIVEFPSIFELYNEHQECSLNVIKMEEDEEIADGMPFFMSETGDDDALVCGSYYNEITLRVCDDGGNCVMERTRGAQAGVVGFPGLRLDVPGGTYTFRFSDDLYGLKLSITMLLREPHEISDTPVADYVSLINDEARDARRRNRGGNYSDDEGEYDEEGGESDDSFIINDLTAGSDGHFSEHEGEEHVEYNSDDEAADEESERRRISRRQRSGRRSEREVEIVDEHDDDGEEADHHEDGEEEDFHERSERRTVQLVHEHEDAAFSSDEEAGHDEPRDVEEEEEPGLFIWQSRSRRRNANQIFDSEDEGESEGAAEEEDTDQIVDDAADGNVGDVSEDEETVSPVRNGKKTTREQWEEGEGESDADADASLVRPVVAFSDDGESDSSQRPLKRARDRIVESDDEDVVDMEQSIEIARSLNAHDDDEVDNGSQLQSTEPFDEEEGGDDDDQQVYDEAQQEDGDGGPDYPDEEEEEDRYQEEEGDEYGAEFSE